MKYLISISQAQKIFMSIWVVFLALNNPVAASPEEKIATFTVGISLGPYILKNGTGIVGDIVSASLKESGYKVQYNFFSNIDALSLFEKQHYDALAVVRPKMVNAFLSVPVITFQNKVISLAENEISITQFADLKNYKILAFSNARRYLGPLFASTIGQLPHSNYKEITSQEKQVLSLLKGETDIIILDETIFEYYRKKLINSAPFNQSLRRKVSYSSIFPPSTYHIAFHSKDLQKAFDFGYSRLKLAGSIEAVKQKYRKLLNHY